MSNNPVTVSEPSRTARTPIRSPMPYGVVMATGAASTLSGDCGLGMLAAPLLWLALAEAVTILLITLVRGRLRITASRPQFGLLTIPIGLAVIGIGLAGRPGVITLDSALSAVCLAWLTTVLLGLAIGNAMTAEQPGISAVSGVWFLAPACLLADASATAAVLPRMPAPLSTAATWAALIGCGLGVAGYVVVVLAAALRVRLAGLGTPRAPWWISAGCGGLAAATLGRVAAFEPTRTPIFGLAALGVWCLGSALLVPVVAASLRHLVALRRPWGPVVWPPTFSTGVYALGALQVGRLVHLPAVTAVGVITAAATLALWAGTNLLRLLLVWDRAGGRVD